MYKTNESSEKKNMKRLEIKREVWMSHISEIIFPSFCLTNGIRTVATSKAFSVEQSCQHIKGEKIPLRGLNALKDHPISPIIYILVCMVILSKTDIDVLPYLAELG